MWDTFRAPDSVEHVADLPFETASWRRRFLALFIDWIASILVVVAIFGTETYTDARGAERFYVLGVFIVETALFTWLAGGSFGKLLTGLRVVSARGTAGGLFNPVTLLARQALIALVIPALVFRPDGRGLHDVLTGTATVTKDVFEGLRAPR